MVAGANMIWSMGPGTFEVPLDLFALNRRRLGAELPADTIAVLQGGTAVSFNDTDVDYLFRQESYFMWASGVREVGCFLAIQGGTGAATLFIPRLPEDYAIWMGPLLAPEDFKKIYQIDDVYYVDQIVDILSEKNPSKLLVLNGVNSDSGLTSKEASFDGIDKFVVDNKILFPIIAELRVIKTEMEQDVLRYVAKISSDAHKQVMLYARPELMEFHCEAVFLNWCYEKGGCRYVSYTCICASGNNSAVLHYGHPGAPNTRKLQNGDMCLYDMGANYAGYAADITCSFPANGKFTENQKIIYNAVLAANNAVLNNAKPGVMWPDMHILANKVMLQHLVDGGILVGDVEDMIKAGIHGIFQPHGLGHFLGVDVHDVGGYLPGNPARPPPPLNSLRTARELKAGMAITVEPGCYFIDKLLDKALADPEQSKFIVADRLKEFRNFGGVRIEDDILITSTGVENMTMVPRTVEEIESWMAGGANFKKNKSD